MLALLQVGPRVGGQSLLARDGASGGGPGRRGRLGHRNLGLARGHQRFRQREFARVLLAARRPAALLNAVRADRHAPRLRGKDHADGQHTVLPPAFDDVAELHEHGLLALVLDLQLANVPGLDDLDHALGESLLQRRRDRTGGRRTAHEVDRKVLMRHRLGDAWGGVGGAQLRGQHRQQSRNCRNKGKARTW
jgi:hypothetical protein